MHMVSSAAPAGVVQALLEEGVMIDEPMKAETVGGWGSDWWDVDREILDCLAGDHRAMSVAELATRLRLSEGEATSLLAMLAREGKIRICQVMLAA